MIYRGFGVGTSVYVGNSIGRKCDLRLAGGGLRDVAASFGASSSGNEDDVTIGGDDDDGLGGGGDGDSSDGGGDDSNLDDALVQAAARDAKTFCWTGLLTSVVVQLLVSTAYYFLREQLASIFTDDQDVVDKSMNATLAAAAAAVGYAMVMPANMVRARAHFLLQQTSFCGSRRRRRRRRHALCWLVFVPRRHTVRAIATAKLLSQTVVSVLALFTSRSRSLARFAPAVTNSVPTPSR
jgi:hypothetical protein